MSDERFARTKMLLGKEALAVLSKKKVAVFGAGGVGGAVIEALARSGVGAIDIIDDDKISITNLNRQLLALSSTIGEYKADLAVKRIADINPDCNVRAIKKFFLPENASGFDLSDCDYIVDAIDTVSGKIALVILACERGIPIISSMGTGNKTDPTKLQISDIYKTSVCPLARVMRRELKKRRIKKLKVVYSTEEPATPFRDAADCAENENETEREGRPLPTRKDTPASAIFVPACAGLLIASEVIKDLIKK